MPERKLSWSTSVRLGLALLTGALEVSACTPRPPSVADLLQSGCENGQPRASLSLDLFPGQKVELPGAEIESRGNGDASILITDSANVITPSGPSVISFSLGGPTSEAGPRVDVQNQSVSISDGWPVIYIDLTSGPHSPTGAVATEFKFSRACTFDH